MIINDEFKKLLESAFNSGEQRGYHLGGGNPSTNAPDDFEDWFKQSFDKEEEKEETERFTFATLNRKISWDELCEIIHVDYYKKSWVDTDETFEIPFSIIKKYNL